MRSNRRPPGAAAFLRSWKPTARTRRKPRICTGGRSHWPAETPRGESENSFTFISSPQTGFDKVEPGLQGVFNETKTCIDCVAFNVDAGACRPGAGTFAS